MRQRITRDLLDGVGKYRRRGTLRSDEVLDEAPIRSHGRARQRTGQLPRVLLERWRAVQKAVGRIEQVVEMESALLTVAKFRKQNGKHGPIDDR